MPSYYNCEFFCSLISDFTQLCSHLNLTMGIWCSKTIPDLGTSYTSPLKKDLNSVSISTYVQSSKGNLYRHGHFVLCISQLLYFYPTLDGAMV